MAEPVTEDEEIDPYEAFSKSPRAIFSPEEYRDYVRARQSRPKIILLIERFYHQTRYGCTATLCETTACRTHREQKSKEKGIPYRAPAPSTARALSSYLASLDDPVASLCPNIPAPKTNPFDVAFPVSRAMHFLRVYDGPLTNDLAAAKEATANFLGPAEWFAKAEIEEWMNTQSLSGKSIDLRQALPYKMYSQIDTKSFAQTLFSSFAWKLVPFFEDHQRNPSAGPPKADHLLSNVEGLHDPLRNLLPQGSMYDRKPSAQFFPTDLRTVSSVKSLLSAGGIDNALIRRIYEDKEYRYSHAREGNFFIKNYISKSSGRLDAIRLLQTLSDPIGLLQVGLDPLPYPLLGGGLFHNLLEFPVGQEPPGLTFLHMPRVQSHEVLWVEMVLLIRNDYTLMQRVLETLVSPVKISGFVSNVERRISGIMAVHYISFAVAALTASVLDEVPGPETWRAFEDFRREGFIQFDSFNRPRDADFDKQQIKCFERWSLAYEDPAAQHLAKLVFRAFASWSYLSAEPTEKMNLDNDAKATSHVCSVFKNLLQMFFLSGPLRNGIYPGQLILVMLEWSRTIFLRNWDGNYRFQWNTDVGTAIEFMFWVHQWSEALSVSPNFEMDILIDRMDYVEACRDWMNFEMSSSTGHLFDYAWLFPEDAKVIIFRSVNLCRMFAAFVTSVTMNQLVQRLEASIKEQYRQVLEKLAVAMDKTFILQIRRDNILGDAFDQLWRRQKRELFRPLRVRMGMDEGEEGVDMGGVQQEFFRLAIADALDPTKGLFTVDERTRMTWFQPMSVAPLYQYTLIGLLFGLAVYNGITLSITFPLAFYRKLLGQKNNDLSDIQDGWPALYDGLNSLQNWTDGPVEDIFLRTYTFSFESHGIVHDIDMQKIGPDDEWPRRNESHADIAKGSNGDSARGSSNVTGGEHLVKAEDHADATPSFASDSKSVGSSFIDDSSEADMVTDLNRDQYIEDYVFWLTEKSIEPQFKAFAEGFFLPLQKKALNLFTPAELQHLLEGNTEIDVAELKQTADYEDGYFPNHPKIEEFWSIVQTFSAAEHSKLLEFVTASPRIPVRGIGEVNFIIQRNGVGDERLPTSMTCFGRLLLPEYSSRQIMAEKLRLAIENSTGFGTQ